MNNSVIHVPGGIILLRGKTMNRYRGFYDNLASFIGALGGIPGTRYSVREPGVALYDSGVPDAYENYALLAPDAANGPVDTIRRGLAFFAMSGNAHIWPVFPGVADGLCGILEDCGLARDGDFHAMIAETSRVYFNYPGSDIVETVHGDDEVRQWADCAWRGFDSEGEPPEPFVSNARCMARKDDFTLVHVGSKAVGMLYAGGAGCGIYYVATRPEYRGQGLARVIIEGLKTRARTGGFGRVVLLATSNGRKSYLKQGFEDVGKVRIYRMDGNLEA
ncbi:MAG: GNAT family N-acetyltransferase [Synergistaceae bacterium]|nr:GNAT family N-acetyltransferase [Synergistaceae bacterium]